MINQTEESSINISFVQFLGLLGLLCWLYHQFVINKRETKPSNGTSYPKDTHLSFSTPFPTPLPNKKHVHFLTANEEVDHIKQTHRHHCLHTALEHFTLMIEQLLKDQEFRTYTQDRQKKSSSLPLNYILTNFIKI